MQKKFFLITFLSLTLVGCTAEHTEPDPDVNFDTYDVYPAPQEIEYRNKNASLNDTITIVSEHGIDSTTINHAIKIITDKEKHYEISDKLSSTNTNLVLGIYGSHGIAQKTFKVEEITYIPSKIDSYALDISASTITILGKDDRSTFYGLTSLEYIFEQCEDKSVRELTIKDYAQSNYRGYIEGFYGIPWTSDERIHLMQQAYRAKANIYIYAPKNDTYHSTKWRTLYNSDDLANLKKQIEVGKANKINFAWAIHPFQNSPITSSSYNTDLAAIKTKFDQVYNAGCRQFVVCADDVGGLSTRAAEIASLHRKLMNDLVVWNDSKGDCAEISIVPSGYTTRSGYYADKYLPELCNGLSNKVHIMWTGSGIFSQMTTMAFNQFSQYTNNRKPFIWLNWPVNDGWQSYLLMGSGKGVLNKIYEDGEVAFDGIVCNPLVQAEPSIFNIWETCNYAWNTKKYNPDTCIYKSYSLFEEAEADNFRYIADILNTDKDNCFFKEFEEASLLRKAAEPFISKYEAKQSYTNELVELKSYITSCLNACESYLKNASNIQLRKTLTPWVNSIVYYLKIAEISCNILTNPSNFTAAQISENCSKCKEFYRAVSFERSHFLNTNSNTEIVEKVNLGTYYFVPFINRIYSYMVEQTNPIYVKESITRENEYTGFSTIYQGNVENITDGDTTTYCWFGDIPTSCSFISIDLGEVKAVNNVYISFGTTTGKDKMTGEIQISEDGVNFIKVGQIASDTVYTYKIELSKTTNARFVRLINYDGTNNTWTAITEFGVNY